MHSRRTGRRSPPRVCCHPKRGVPSSVPLRALLHGAAPSVAGDLRPQTLSPLGPRSPSAPGSPCVREKTDAISPHCPPGDARPTTALSPSPAHHIVPGSGCFGCPTPFCPATHLRSLGSSRATLAREAHQAALHHIRLWAGCSQGWRPGDPRKVPPGAQPSPSPYFRGLDMAIHPRRCRLAAPLGDGPQQQPSPTLGPGGPGGPGKPSLPWGETKNRLNIKGGMGQQSHPSKATPGPHRASLFPPESPPVPPRGTQHRGGRGDRGPISAHLLPTVALLAPVTLGKQCGGCHGTVPKSLEQVPQPSPHASAHTHLLAGPPSLPQLPGTARHPGDARLARLPRLPGRPLGTPVAHGTARGALGARGTLVPLVTFGSSLAREA